MAPMPKSSASLTGDTAPSMNKGKTMIWSASARMARTMAARKRVPGEIVTASSIMQAHGFQRPDLSPYSSRSHAQRLKIRACRGSGRVLLAGSAEFTEPACLGLPVTIPHASNKLRKRGVPPHSVKDWTRSAGRGVSPAFRRVAPCRPGDPPPLVPVLDGIPRSLALA
jgi:hypothetical protein